MRQVLFAVPILLLAGAASAADARLPAADARAALALAVGESIELPGLPLGEARSGSVRMRRIDVYAADAKIYAATAAGLRELPRSDWGHFVADATVPGAPRLGLSISADGQRAVGLLLASDGSSQSIEGRADDSGLAFELRSAKVDEHGNPARFACDNHEMSWALQSQPRFAGAAVLASASSPQVATRTATVAVDTDGELLVQKFSGSTANATNYLAQLFVGMNVVYERDLDLRLLQGTTILRTDPNTDPWSQSTTGAQLTEFGTFWQNNQGAVQRAFAMLVSGKSPDPNSSAGVAWVLGGSNYCTSTNANGGHYSVSQVFKFAGATAAFDVLVIAHEIGHNFGAEHTHCSNATTGAGTVNTNTIDQCYNLESGLGCFGGAQVCPAPSTVNGVPNVTGTLMSYCHLNGIAGCDSSEVFATAHRTLLSPRVTNNVNNGCFAPLGGGNSIFANGFE